MLRTSIFKNRLYELQLSNFYTWTSKTGNCRLSAHIRANSILKQGVCPSPSALPQDTNLRCAHQQLFLKHGIPAASVDSSTALQRSLVKHSFPSLSLSVELCQVPPRQYRCPSWNRAKAAPAPLPIHTLRPAAQCMR